MSRWWLWAPVRHATSRSPRRACYAVLAHEIAHEIAHVAARDARVTLAAVIVERIVTTLALCAVAVAIVERTPLVAALCSVLWARWVSRSVEYAADALAARVSGEGTALAVFLERFFPSDLPAWARPFATHPPTVKRSKRLRTH